jgi:hypothetical protein
MPVAATRQVCARRRLTVGRQTARPYPLLDGLSPPPGSGWRRPGPDLNQQAQHIRLGETLDDTVAAEMQDGDAGQRDVCLFCFCATCCGP